MISIYLQQEVLERCSCDLRWLESYHVLIIKCGRIKPVEMVEGKMEIDDMIKKGMEEEPRKV